MVQILVALKFSGTGSVAGTALVPVKVLETRTIEPFSTKCSEKYLAGTRPAFSLRKRGGGTTGKFLELIP